MIVIVEEGKVKDFLGKANQVAHKAYDTYKKYSDYSEGKRDSLNDYNFDTKATATDIRKTALRRYVNDLKFTAKKDNDNNLVMVQFSSREVPKNMMNRIDPRRKNSRSDSLSSYITDYDDASHIVTMILPMNNSSKGKAKSEDLEINLESATVFNSRNCDEWNDDNLAINEDIIEETPGLELSAPKVKYEDEDDYDGYLEISINGKVYKYKVNKDVPKTTSEVADTVSKMQKYSDGKALAYLKKNMHLVESTSFLGDKFIFGKEEAEKYRDIIKRRLGGKKVTKRVDLAEKPGGLVYESNILGIDMWDLLKALEGMRAQGEVIEIDDSTYYVKSKSGDKDEVREDINKDDFDEYDEDEGSDTDDRIIKIINDVYKERGEIDSEDSVSEIEKRLDDDNLSVDSDHLGSMIVKSKEMIDLLDENQSLDENYVLTPGKEYESKSGHRLKILDTSVSLSGFDGHPMIKIDYEYHTTEGHEGTSTCSDKDFFDMLNEMVLLDSKKKSNPFKSHHVCDGCGNTLDKCTCEVDESIQDEDDLYECTQPSNIGQHKVDSIDMVEDPKYGKIVKDLED